MSRSGWITPSVGGSMDNELPGDMTTRTETEGGGAIASRGRGMKETGEWDVTLPLAVTGTSRGGVWGAAEKRRMRG
ncbi:hypothetical protein CONPUDRAFT_151439 [Coniophora puteana RWD-64-598 SS2]|uniref:Uncharacterized protein n=1 Tax=Coniophora puteana (strain RWD-64-598) TaxID=741705 RepID=A0A5M3MZG4_CONPW|nr:uncharacterized protein CONPUDRAFT_151439 [Coniophora puteana RWD-64-598 SS2]EIW84416.1 hypothetical protein CONPUDRAFT_151439 [Coniophora puteana RWD-64-598 SS2]